MDEVLRQQIAEMNTVMWAMIDAHLASRGKSLKWLADAAGQPISTVRGFKCHKEIGPSILFVESVCRALELKPSDILKKPSSQERMTDTKRNTSERVKSVKALLGLLSEKEKKMVLDIIYSYVKMEVNNEKRN